MEEETGFQVLHVPEHWALRERYHGPLYVLVARPPPNGGLAPKLLGILVTRESGIKTLGCRAVLLSLLSPSSPPLPFLLSLFLCLPLSFLEQAEARDSCTLR